METVQKNSLILKGNSIEYYNDFLVKEYKKHNITEGVIFNSERLKMKVEESKHFMKGLISYLSEVDKELNKMSNNAELNAWAFQVIAELGTLIYPNSGTCYSLIPQDLKKINWSILTQEKNKILKGAPLPLENKKIIQAMLDTFFDENNQYPQTLICIISASLSTQLTQSINNSFVNSLSTDTISEFSIELPASGWISRLASSLKDHIVAVNYYQIKSIDQIDILPYCESLAAKITNVLENKKLFSSLTYNKKNNPTKKVNVYVWQGSNLLIFPKQLCLPMRHFPRDWTINKFKMAESGGFFLSEFTNISYQGYLDSKSLQMHNHRLYIKDSIKQINELQKVKFMINDKMVNFINEYKHELTDGDNLLITDKWITLTEDTSVSQQRKWSQVYGKPKEARRAIISERITKRNETLRNQDMLSIAELFRSYPFYWPAVHDFRGRIYRISNLNIQMNEFARSLICFYSDKPPVTNRKKNKKTFEQFNLLLKEILNDDRLIQEWDAVFGNRFINKHAFEELLLDSILNNKLSLIQVSQLLLLRAKEYDKIGIYYDASASAYQIMGMLNLEKDLCELTNVIGDNNNSIKKDIYEFFKTEFKNIKDYKNIQLKPNEDPNMKTLIENCLTKKLDRQLVKAAVMPLIYGKTAYGFAEDLESFFAKNALYPMNSSVLKLANFIINMLKTHTNLSNANSFMVLIQKFAKVLFDLDNVVMLGPYNQSMIKYSQVITERLSVYSRKKHAGVQRQRISLNRQKKDERGIPIQSKNKTVNAFVANFVHFIDGQICHFVIEQFGILGYNDIATIHDCFYIKPKHKLELQCIYKAGLVMGIFIYELNLAIWIKNIMNHYKIPVTQELTDYINQLENIILNIRKERRNYPLSMWDFNRYPLINNEILIAAIELIQENIHSKTKANLETILYFLKERNLDSYEIILSKLQFGSALFPDNT